MVSDRDLQRRVFLGGVSAALLGLAGCTTSDDPPAGTDPAPGTTASGTPGSPPSPTAGADPTDTGTATPGQDPVEPPSGGETDSWTGLDRGEVVDSFDEFEAQWWTGDGSATTSEDIAYGDGTSVYLTTEGTNRVRITRAFDSVRDFSGAGFSMAVRLEETTADLVRPVLMLEDLFGTRRLLSGSVRTEATERWIRMDLGVREGRGIDMSAIKEMTVHLRDGDDTTGLYVDDIRVHDVPDHGHVMFLFEDGDPRDYGIAFPTLQQYGFQGACFPRASAVGENTSPSLSEYREMQEQGWDIGGYTVNREILSKHTRREQEVILERNKQWLEDNGFTHGARCFLAPRGAYNSHTLDVIEDYFDLSFVGGSSSGNNFQVTDPRTVEFIRAEDYERSKHLIDAARDYNQLLVLTLQMENMPSRGAFEDLIAHAAAHERQGHIEVITPSTLLDDHIRG